MKKLLLSLVAVAFIVPSVTFASIDANLKYGSRGMEVTELQEFLIDKGFLTGQTSGNFFALTRKAVIAWQASVGLPATGFVGSMSRAKINEDLSTANASAVSAEVAETGTTALTQTQTTSSAVSFASGCTSSTGFSTTTGKPCSTNVVVSNTTANKTITFPNGSIAEIDSRGDVVRWVKEATVIAQSLSQTTQNQTSTNNVTDLSISLSDATATINSVHISWSTSIPSNSKVFLTQTPVDLYTNSTQVIPSASGYSTQHFINIPNLIPNTQYSYTIEATNGTQVKKQIGVINTNALPTPTISNISVNSPSPQSVVANVSSQQLGSFSLTVTNQPVVIKSMRFSITSSNSSDTLTNISLLGVAGPVDENVINKTFTFTDSINLPIGASNGGLFYLSGKVSGQNGDTITITTNPSTDWVVQGKDNGASALLPNTTITFPVTILGPTLSVSLLPPEAPTPFTVSAGTPGVLMDAIQLSAGVAEDIRLSSIKLTTSAFAGLSNCQLFDGATVLNFGSNNVNPGSNTAIFTFDSPLTVFKGTATTLRLKCDISPSATGSFVWSIATSNLTEIYSRGNTSGSSFVPTITNSVGPTITVL